MLNNFLILADNILLSFKFWNDSLLNCVLALSFSIKEDRTLFIYGWVKENNDNVLKGIILITFIMLPYKLDYRLEHWLTVWH